MNIANLINNLMNILISSFSQKYILLANNKEIHRRIPYITNYCNDKVVTVHKAGTKWVQWIPHSKIIETNYIDSDEEDELD